MSEERRPQVTDILAEFSRKTAVTSLQRLTPNLKELLAHQGEHCDILDRPEAVILDLRGGRIVLYDSGTMRGRFRDVDVSHITDLLTGIAQQILTLPDFSTSESYPLVDADVIYRIRTASSVVECLAKYVNKDELAKNLWSDPKAIKATAFTLFLNDPREEDCIRVHIGPHRDDPCQQYYLRISRVIRSVAIDDLKSRVTEMLSFFPDKLLETR